MSELSLGQIKGLPVNSNVVTVPSGHALYAPGHVLQVVSAAKTDTFTTSSTSFVDITGMSVSITPISNTSKILVITNIHAAEARGVNGIMTRMMRDATPIAVGDAAGSRSGITLANHTSDANWPEASSMTFLDSPSSTSSLTYKLQMRATSATTVYFNRGQTDSDNANTGRFVSTITVMEIAA